MSEAHKPAPDMTQEEKRALLARLLKEKAREQVQHAPLSDGQRAMWFIQQSAPGNTGYNVNMAVRICSPLDASQFQKAIQAVVNRHATLRTTYRHVGDQPIQQIYPYQDADFELVDASAFDDAELRRRVMDATMQPFDLENGPVARWRLFRVSPQNHVFTGSFHHIAMDGVSFALILDDLRKALRALQAGEAIQLGDEPQPYQNWAAWQREMLASPAGQAHHEYWLQQLAGELPLLSLPYDFPHPPIQTYRGDSLNFAISAQDTRQLRALAQSAGVTSFTLLVAVYQILLHRYTNQAEILVGSPTAGRGHPDFRKTVGYFVNPVVLRSTLEGVNNFRDYLNRVKTTVLDALAHQDYPFIRVVESLRAQRDPSRSPVFQTTFNLINARYAGDIPNLANPAAKKLTGEFAGLQIEPYYIPQQEGAFELALEVLDTEDAYVCTLHYHTDLFRRATVERFAASYQQLLQQVLTNPAVALSDLDVLAPQERHRLLVAWNQTQADYPRDACAHQLFEAQVERAPDASAVVFEGESLTYAQLNARANQLAAHLRALGVTPDQKVGVYLDRSLEMVIAVLAVLKAGGAYVPMDPLYPAGRLQMMVEDSQMAVVITQAALADTLSADNPRLQWVTLDAQRFDSYPPENLPVAGGSQSLAYVIFTSGSTGRPKGVQIPHRALVNLLTFMQRQHAVAPGDILAAITTLSFDIATMELLLPLIAGAQVSVLSADVAADGFALAEALDRCGATILQATPATWRLLVETGWSGRQGLKMISGGEPMPLSLARKLLEKGSELWNQYGPTETTIYSTVSRICPDDSVITVGRPIANTQVYILDAHLQPAPTGVTGMLYIGGDGLARDYLNRADLTAERFLPNPFGAGRIYNTGDLARYLPDGRIECLGRADTQVKVRGFRIELGEIEAVLNQHPSVGSAVVLAREDRPGDKRLVAYYVSQAALTARELTRFLRDKLPAYMLPSAYVALESFPLTPNGKINRKALPAPVQGDVEDSLAVQLPNTPTEQLLAQIWADVLEVRQVSLTDNFFDLGGHSLLAMRLVLEIQTKTGQRIEPAYLRFESLGQLAARLDNKLLSQA